jgi:hypothetical protein
MMVSAGLTQISPGAGFIGDPVERLVMCCCYFTAVIAPKYLGLGDGDLGTGDRRK